MKHYFDGWTHGGTVLVLLAMGLLGCRGPQRAGLLQAPYATSAAATAEGRRPPSLPTAAMPATVTASPMPVAPSASPAASFDAAALAAQMLALINADRADAGLAPVARDDTAAAVAVAYASDMLDRDYFSHWNPAGLGPDHRYSAAGGSHAVMENLYAATHAFQDGRGAPIDDWGVIIQNAHAALMQSAGHRANILDPAHSHVGIGLAYDPGSGRLRLAQEFTNHHAELSAPLPAEARPGDTLRVAGAFGSGALGNGILDLAYEPFPAPLLAAELAARSTYASPAASVETRPVGLAFDETLVLPATPGFYHVRLFVDLANGQALVVDHLVAVR